MRKDRVQAGALICGPPEIFRAIQVRSRALSEPRLPVSLEDGCLDFVPTKKQTSR
jgi:hypothetical protein